VTPAFQAMGSVLRRAQRAADAGGAAALRGEAPEVASTGIALLRSSLPHDLRRADVLRFHEGRAAFGAALGAWQREVDAGRDAGLVSALQALVDAYWGWVDAYKGLPPERAV
jgi:hypothetical protein